MFFCLDQLFSVRINKDMSIHTVEADTANWIDMGHQGNGVLGSYALLATFELVNPEGLRPPLLRMPTSIGAGAINYEATSRFMDRVVAASRMSKEEGVALFTGGDPYIEKFHDVARSGEAIEMLLNPPPAEVDPRAWSERVMGTEAARSVLERKVLVHYILTAHGKDLLNENPSRRLNLLSIASGWGRLPLDVMSNFAPGEIQGVFVDVSERAIDASRSLAQEKRLIDRVRAVQTDFFHFFPTLQRAEQGVNHLIESTGFIDYLGDRLVRRIFEACRGLVSEDGVVVITNITSDREEAYLDTVWGEMNRRTPEQLAAFAQSVGFDPSKTTLILDSTATMCTIVARP